MSDRQSGRTQSATAAETCAKANLKGQSLKLLRDGLSPRAFFDLLVEHDQFGDAVRFLAQALPKRAAIWWGCLCLWDVCWPDPAEAVERAMRAAVQWVLDPSEPNRRSAEKAGRAAGFQTAAGCLAMAVFWSSGSMSRPDLPPVPPPAHLTGRMVSAAVLLGAALQAPKMRHAYRRFLRLGLEVALGKNLWQAKEEAESKLLKPMPDDAAETKELLVAAS